MRRLFSVAGIDRTLAAIYVAKISRRSYRVYSRGVGLLKCSILPAITSS